MEPGKIFVGGISWDTNEDRLREYFQTFGEVLEAVIMKDRATGRARGFGFVIYADPIVSELVVRQKHVIDGRTVEAKKAVPRDDQHILNKTQGNPTAFSPVPVRTKKIFVGGLPSTITDVNFKGYFDQFGTITDVVVMYDHNTQRPRGFGFITYDSEEAVERALFKTFHELNGKMVEVKRAVPKELSPVSNRGPIGGIGNVGLTRIINFINGYGHGIAIDESRHNPLAYGRSGLLAFNHSNYGSMSNFEQRMSLGFNWLHQTNNNATRNIVSNDPPNPGSSSWSLWGNDSIGDIVSNSLNTREHGARTSLSNNGLNLAHRVPENVRTRVPPASLSSSSSSLFSGFDNLYNSGREQSWASSGSFEFGIRKGVSNVPLSNPPALCW